MKTEPTTPIGKLDRTCRGFERIDFKDYYGEECSLQASSLAEYEQPGTTAIWLGCEKAKNHHVTGEPLSPRMHLHREQVKSLIEHLQKWVDDGTFRIEGDDHE